MLQVQIPLNANLLQPGPSSPVNFLILPKLPFKLSGAFPFPETSTTLDIPILLPGMSSSLPPRPQNYFAFCHLSEAFLDSHDPQYYLPPFGTEQTLTFGMNYLFICTHVPKMEPPGHRKLLQQRLLCLMSGIRFHMSVVSLSTGLPAAWFAYSSILSIGHYHCIFLWRQL